jgi:hypothetical protein
MTDVFDRIAYQLESAERELWLAGQSAHARVARRPRVRPRRWLRRHFVVVALLVGASSAAGGIAVADSLIATPTDSQYLYGGVRAVPAAATTPDQTADLAILRRPRTTADAIPDGAKMISTAQDTIGVAQDGANVGLARLAQEIDGIGAWVIPGDDGLVCLVVAPIDPASPYQAGAPGCVPATSASLSAQQACDGPNCNDTFRPGETVTDGDLQGYTRAGRGSSLPYYIAGVVPDGVRVVTLTLHGGASETIPVRGNVYMTIVRPAGGYLPAYANLGESPPPPSAPLTMTISFNGPGGPITTPFSAQGPLFTLGD